MVKGLNRSNSGKSVASSLKRVFSRSRRRSVSPPNTPTKHNASSPPLPDLVDMSEKAETHQRAQEDEIQFKTAEAEPVRERIQDLPAELLEPEDDSEVDFYEPRRLTKIEEEIQTQGSELMAAAIPRRHVFAHFMVGNTYPYTVEDWIDDMTLAASQSIDGFVLNIGREDWQKQRVADCFAAADRLPSKVNFKLFFSFDMTSIPGRSTADVQLFQHYLGQHGRNPRMFRHASSNKVVVSTFAGENAYFGQHSMDAGWAYLKSQLNNIVPIHLVPSFFINPARLPSLSAADGAFNWNGSWPLQLQSGMPRNKIVAPVLDSDATYLQYLKPNQTFMAAVSPWFFTHYGPDTWNKNWVYRCDDWLFVRRWEQLIASRENIEIAQVISWNDYGESHYIGPIKGAQPNSQAWVNGYSHEAWLRLNRYFTIAFQTGKYPTVMKDQIFLWARPHPKGALSADKVPRPSNWELVDDTAWVIVFTIAPATVEAYTDGGMQADKYIFQVGKGMTKLSFPLKPDGGMRVVIHRDERVVADCAPIGYRFESRPGVYNFNAFVAMS